MPGRGLAAPGQDFMTAPLNRVPAPAAAAAAVVAAAVADKRPLPKSPIHPGTSASQEAAEAAAPEAEAAVAVVRHRS